MSRTKTWLVALAVGYAWLYGWRGAGLVFVAILTAVPASELTIQVLQRLIGYLMTDGSNRPGQSVKFTNTRACYLEEVEGLVESVAGQVPAATPRMRALSPPPVSAPRPVRCRPRRPRS